MIEVQLCFKLLFMEIRIHLCQSLLAVLGLISSLSCLLDKTLLLEILPVGHIFIVKLTVAELFIMG